MASVQWVFLFNPKQRLIWESQADRFKLLQRPQKPLRKSKKIVQTSSDLLSELHQTKTQVWWNAQQVIHPMLNARKCRCRNRWVKGWICKTIHALMQSFRGKKSSVWMNKNGLQTQALFTIFFKSAWAQCTEGRWFYSHFAHSFMKEVVKREGRAQSKTSTVCMEPTFIQLCTRSVLLRTAKCSEGTVRKSKVNGQTSHPFKYMNTPVAVIVVVITISNYYYY